MSGAPYDTEDLRLFALIHSAGSLSAAERRFGVPKSTLSRSLARLENAAGVALFERIHKGLRPTPLANDLIEFGLTADRAIKGAEQVLRSASEEPSGELVVAAGATSSSFLLSETIARFMTLYPGVEVRLEVTGDAPDPQAEGIDLTIQVGWPENPSLIARRIIAGNTGLYVSPETDLADWNAIVDLGRIVVSAKDAPASLGKIWILRRGAEEVILDSPPRAYVGDPSIAIDLIAAGRGTTLLPMFFAAELEQAGKIRRAFPEWLGPPLELFAVLPPGRRQIAAVRRFLDLLLANAGARRKRASQLGVDPD